MPDFFVFGLETEYGFAGEALPNQLQKELIGRCGGLDKFLSNGGRLYIDIGDHLEYATPECADPFEVARYHHAFDAVVYEELASLNHHARQQSRVYRNNLANLLDSDSRAVCVKGVLKATYGCHENYLIDRSRFRRTTTSLISFLASRPIIAGSGVVVGGDYFLSARALVTDCASWPLVGTRDQPHLPKSDRDRYYRLHLVCGDSNVSPRATELKVGATALALRLLERTGAVPGADAHWKTVLSQINKPVNWLRLKDGSNWRVALEIQQRYLDRLDRFWAKCDLPPWANDIANLWQETLDALASGEINRLVGVIDWPTKCWLLALYREEFRELATGDRLESIDLAYHDLDPAGCLFPDFCPTKFYGVKLVRQACFEPPSLQRPRQRASVIRSGEAYSVDWAGYQEIGANSTDRVEFDFP